MGSGFTLGSFVVSKGVTVAVLSGGIVTSATSVGNGGILELLGGSTASATLLSGATLEVTSGYVLNGQVVSKGRTLDVAADGVASATTILAGGTEIIASGGTELGVKSIASGGLLETAAGGTAIVSGAVTNSGRCSRAVLTASSILSVVRLSPAAASPGSATALSTSRVPATIRTWSSSPAAQAGSRSACSATPTRVRFRALVRTPTSSSI